MAPCTHPGTSRGVNEARGDLILAAGRVRSKEKKLEKKKKHDKNPLHPEHTTKAAAVRRPRPPRDGARKKHVRQHALAHTRPFP